MGPVTPTLLPCLAPHKLKFFFNLQNNAKNFDEVCFLNKFLENKFKEARAFCDLFFNKLNNKFSLRNKGGAMFLGVITKLDYNPRRNYGLKNSNKHGVNFGAKSSG